MSAAVLIVLCALGVYGVLAASSTTAENNRNYALTEAEAAGQTLIDLIRDLTTPVYTVVISARVHPDSGDFDTTWTELVNNTLSTEVCCAVCPGAGAACLGTVWNNLPCAPSIATALC